MYSMEPEQDWQLIKLTAGGDYRSFRILVEKYQRPVLNFAHRFLGSREEAEDAAQETFFKVYKAAGRYRPEARFKTWLFTIVRNVCLNKLRRRKKLFFFPLGGPGRPGEKTVHKEIAAPDNSRPDVELEKKDLSRLVSEAINALPPNQRMATLLKRFEGLSYREIAEVMDTSVPAVEALLFRAKENLKKRLAPLAEDEKGAKSSS